MLKKAFRFIFDSFSIAIFVLFLNMLILRYSRNIILMLLAVVLTGISLRLFRFRRVFAVIISKLLYGAAIYFVLSGFLFFGLSERILLAFYLLTVLFAGSRLYSYTQEGYAFSVSFVSLIVSAVMPSMLAGNPYEGLYLRAFVMSMLLINFLICFFRSNISEIMSITKTGHSIPRRLVKSNRIMVAAAVIIAALSAFFREISDFVSSLGSFIKWLVIQSMLLIYRLMDLLYGREPAEVDDNSIEEVFYGLSGQDREDPLLSKILTYVFFAVLGMMLLAALTFLLIKLYRLALKLIALLSAYVERDRGKTGTGYFDVVEKRKIAEVTRERIIKGVKAFIDEQREKYEPKDEREMIRYLFKSKLRRMRKSGYRYDPSQTACEIYEKQHAQVREEIFSREFTEAYNRARYSSGDVSDIKIDDIR